MEDGWFRSNRSNLLGMVYCLLGLTRSDRGDATRDVTPKRWRRRRTRTHMAADCGGPWLLNLPAQRALER